MTATRPPYQLALGKWIVNAEARRDGQGRLRVYPLPKGDGGGTYEVAGINDRYDGRMAEHLRNLIQLGQQAQAEIDARDYILSNTDIVQPWATSQAIEVYLRDCCFNRGPGGAAYILQLALGYAVPGIKTDSHIGPICCAAIAKVATLAKPLEFLTWLRSSREIYERHIAPPIGERAKFWPGLVNRWNNSLTFAKTFL